MGETVEKAAKQRASSMGLLYDSKEMRRNPGRKEIELEGP